jgi:Domain of unknown function (DUF1877)
MPVREVLRSLVIVRDEVVESRTESTCPGVSSGMVCSVLGVTPAQISALRARPSLVRDLVLVVHDNRLKALLEDVIRHTPAERQAELVERQTRFEQSPAGSELSARTAQARVATAVLGPIGSELGLESSWPLLHFVLTEGAPGDLLLSGEIIGEDLGRGPARLHDEAQTRELSQLLAQQDLEQLSARVDLNAIANLDVLAVPEEPGPDYENELRAEVGIYFPRLRDYVRTMADQGNGLLVWHS